MTTKKQMKEEEAGARPRQDATRLQAIAEAARVCDDDKYEDEVEENEAGRHRGRSTR